MGIGQSVSVFPIILLSSDLTHTEPGHVGAILIRSTLLLAEILTHPSL